MPIFPILLVVIVVGFLLWLVNVGIPMQPTIKQILNAIVIFLLIIWVLDALGIWNYLMTVRVTPLHRIKL